MANVPVQSRAEDETLSQDLLDEFTAPGDQRSLLQRSRAGVQALFRVLFTVLGSLENLHYGDREEQKTPGRIWLQLKGKREAVLKAKEYIKGLCEPEMEEKEPYPKEMHCIFVGAQSLFLNRLITDTSANVTVLEIGVLSIKGGTEPVVMAQSHVQQFVRLFRNNESLPHDQEPEVKRRFKRFVEVHADKYTMDLLILPSALKEELLSLTEDDHSLSVQDDLDLEVSTLNARTEDHSVQGTDQSRRNMRTPVTELTSQLDSVFSSVPETNPNSACISSSHQDRLSTKRRSSENEDRCSKKQFSMECIQVDGPVIRSAGTSDVPIIDLLSESINTDDSVLLVEDEDTISEEAEYKILVNFFKTMGYSQAVVQKVIGDLGQSEEPLKLLEEIEKESQKVSAASSHQKDNAKTEQSYKGLSVPKTESQPQQEVTIEPNVCAAPSNDSLLPKPHSRMANQVSSDGLRSQRPEAQRTVSNTNDRLLPKPNSRMANLVGSDESRSQRPEAQKTVSNTNDRLLPKPNSRMANLVGSDESRSQRPEAQKTVSNANDGLHPKPHSTTASLVRSDDSMFQRQEGERTVSSSNDGLLPKPHSRMPNFIGSDGLMSQRQEAERTVSSSNDGLLPKPHSRMPNFIGSDGLMSQRLEAERAESKYVSFLARGTSSPPQSKRVLSPEKPGPSNLPPVKFAKQIPVRVTNTNCVATPMFPERKPAPYMRQANPEPPVTGVQIFLNAIKTPYRLELKNEPGREDLRHIIIDGSNVAMSHGLQRFFSCRGIAIAVEYFWKKGHRKITVFVPQWRTKRDPNITEQNFLQQLEELGILSFTPARTVLGSRIVSHDDRFLLHLAEKTGGIIVTNDNLREFVVESPAWMQIIKDRLLQYTFVGDIFMIPDDPLGRHGPKLDDFLRSQSENRNVPLTPQPSDSGVFFSSHDASFPKMPPSHAGPLRPRIFPAREAKPAFSPAIQHILRPVIPPQRSYYETLSVKDALLKIFPESEQREKINQVLSAHPYMRDLNALSAMILD